MAEKIEHKVNKLSDKLCAQQKLNPIQFNWAF